MSRVYETAIKIGATISKAFKSDTYNAAAALTKLADATKLLKSAEKSAAAFKKLDGELVRSKGHYDLASEALRRLGAAERAAGGATRESTKWRKAGEREVAKAAREFDRASKAAKKHGEILRAAGVDTAKLASEQIRLARALAATERQEKSLEHFEHSRERLFGKKKEKTPLLEKAGEQFKGIGESVLHLTEGALVAGEAMHLLVEKTMHAGAEVGETAEKLGIGARALQELRYGARQSGAEVEDLDRALSKMAINIGKHKLLKGKGGGGAAIPGLQMLGVGGGAAAAGVDVFKKIGLARANLAVLKPEEQLKKIADGMAKLKTHAERAAIAQEIFGKGAVAILPYLAEGSEGIEKLSKSANKFGGVLSEESVAAAVEAEKASKDMDLAFAGLANTLGSVLLPTAVKAFKGISKWIGDNKVQVQQWGENAAKWIEDKGVPAFKHIASEVQTFGGRVLWLVEGAAKLTGGFGNLVLVMAGLRIAPLAVTMSKIGYQTYKAAAALLEYVAAKKALAAAGGGIPGLEAPALSMTGKAIGIAASAAMVLGAAAVGYAIGTYLDNKFGISDWIAGTSKGKKTIAVDKDGQIANPWYQRFGLVGVRQAKGNAGVAQHQAQLAKVKQLMALHYTYEQASAVVFHGASVGPPAMPRTGAAGGGGVHIAPVIHIHGHASREDVAKAMDKAKQHVLDAHDKRAAHRKRVSFAH